MGFYDSFMSNTVGVVWRAASGTVDPWTKANIVCCEAQSCIQAQGVNPCCATSCQLQAAQTSAACSVTTVLKQDNADCSQVKCGLKNSVGQLNPLSSGSVAQKFLIYGIVAIVIIAVVMHYADS